jgi:16S rRNA (uracil1498-N3)-methyltransferase
MGREQRRLLIDPGRLQQAPAGLVGLTAAESRYLVKVLRYGPGAVFAIGDGAGGLWEAELIEPLGAQLRQPLEAPLAWQPPPTPPLVLLAALVKRDYEVLLRMAVELGADWLLPCRAEFDAVAGQPNLERWRTIAREAAEQCERPWLPQLQESRPARDWLGATIPLPPLGGPSPGSVPAPPAGDSPAALKVLATTRQSGAVPLLEVLEGWTAREPPASLWLACGPEGGWSGAEETLAQDQGWIAVDLGPRILRSSTAAVAGLGLLSDWRYRRWRC